jgi:hypothetical protein
VREADLAAAYSGVVHAQSRRRPQMPVEDFEALARRAPETVWLEFIGGRLVVKRGPDGDRSEIVAWLQRLWAGQEFVD